MITVPVLHDHPSKGAMAKMRAILVKDGKGPLENLYIGETAMPTLKSHEVLVKACIIAELRDSVPSHHHAQITSDCGVWTESHGYFTT
jgi:hypothetical protein